MGGGESQKARCDVKRVEVYKERRHGTAMVAYSPHIPLPNLLCSPRRYSTAACLWPLPANRRGGRPGGRRSEQSGWQQKWRSCRNSCDGRSRNTWSTSNAPLSTPSSCRRKSRCGSCSGSLGRVFVKEDQTMRETEGHKGTKRDVGLRAITTSHANLITQDLSLRSPFEVMWPSADRSFHPSFCIMCFSHCRWMHLPPPNPLAHPASAGGVPRNVARARR